MRRTPLLSLLLSLALTAACQKSAPPARPGAEVATTPMPPAAAAPAPAPATLTGLLEQEAAHRPTGTARAEDVLAAFAAAGIEVPDAKQVVARTVGASYCQGGLTRQGTLVAVCEYDSADAARLGRERSLAAFHGAAPDRTILVAGQTTLTLAPTPGGAQEVARLAELFAKR